MGDARTAPLVVAAAGTVPWRRRSGRLEVALVHRPRYDDWSWPKGKLDPGEEWTGAAVRETQEETGLRVRLGRPLPTNTYSLSRGTAKTVRYWAGEVVGGDGRLENEIDEVRWLPPGKARRLLTSPRDVAQLDALTHGPVDTRTILVVRHARAVPRKQWTDDDRRRPLNDAGTARARDMAPILAAYAPTRVVSSPSTRCADTVSPFVAAEDLTPAWSVPLSEEGFEDEPGALRGVVRDALEGREPTVFCSHGPVLGALLDEIIRGRRLPGKHVKRTLRAVRRDNLDKGEVLALHISHEKPTAVVAVERHRP